MRTKLDACKLGGAVSLLSLIGATLLGGSAHAQATEEETAVVAAPEEAKFERVAERAPRNGTPLIANKLYPMQFRFELGADFVLSYGDKYVEHTGGSGRIGFHVFDWLALEGFGGYLVGSESNITQFVRLRGYSADLGRTNRDACFSTTCEPQLPDLFQTTWFAGANVQWSPIYGKISAVSEYDLNFQLYARLGGGVEGITKALNGATGATSEAQIRPTVNGGIGLRLIPWKYIAIRAELVNYLGFSPNIEEHEGQEADCPDGYLLLEGATENCKGDFSNNAMIQLGLSILL
jgi:outer membrane beta-barrel protein